MNRMDLHLVTVRLVKTLAHQMRRYTRIFLAVTFALLQCVSPLAHAHIGGDPSGQRIHIHEVEQQLDHIARLSNGNVSVETSEAPVIGMQQSKPRSGMQLDFNQPLAHTHFPSFPALAATAIKFSPLDTRPSPPLLFRKPYPQAPPAL